MNNKYPIYMTELLKKHPSISSGRKNIKKHHLRVLKTKSLIRKFIITSLSKHKI